MTRKWRSSAQGILGLPLAVEFGKSRPVVGFDINLSRIAELRSGGQYAGGNVLKTWRLPGSFPSNQLDDIADYGVFIVTVPDAD